MNRIAVEVGPGLWKVFQFDRILVNEKQAGSLGEYTVVFAGVWPGSWATTKKPEELAYLQKMQPVPEKWSWRNIVRRIKPARNEASPTG